MPMKMVKVEISVPKDVVSFKVVGVMRSESGMGLELFEIPYIGLTGKAEEKQDAD